MHEDWGLSLHPSFAASDKFAQVAPYDKAASNQHSVFGDVFENELKFCVGIRLMHSTWFALVSFIPSLSPKLPLPGDSEGPFRSSSQATTCYTRWRIHTQLSVKQGSCAYQ